MTLEKSHGVNKLGGGAKISHLCLHIIFFSEKNQDSFDGGQIMLHAILCLAEFLNYFLQRKLLWVKKGEKKTRIDSIAVYLGRLILLLYIAKCKKRDLPQIFYIM